MSSNVEGFFDRFLSADEQRQIGMALDSAKKHVSSSKEKTCGKCHFWMMSSLCPQERNVNGTSRGPSSGSYVARGCEKFEMSVRAKKRTEELEGRVDVISKAKCFADLPPHTFY